MEKLNIPNDGEAISFENSVLSTPNFPIIPFIIGDGIGIDVTPVMMRVLNAFRTFALICLKWRTIKKICGNN